MQPSTVGSQLYPSRVAISFGLRIRREGVVGCLSDVDDDFGLGRTRTARYVEEGSATDFRAKD